MDIFDELKPKELHVYKNDVVVKYHWRGIKPDLPQERDKVTEFTKQSRRRLAFVASNTPIDFLSMVTLTYPARYSNDGKAVKRHLKRFIQRCQRRWRPLAYLWFIEFQARGAPHFHILLSCQVQTVDYQWVAAAWYEIVDSGDSKHYLAGTRTERITKPDGARRYAVKYAFKMRQKHVPKAYQDVGRFWGHSLNVKPKPILPPAFIYSKDQLYEVMKEWGYIDVLKSRPLSILYNGATDAMHILKFSDFQPIDDPHGLTDTGDLL